MGSKREQKKPEPSEPHAIGTETANDTNDPAGRMHDLEPAVEIPPVVAEAREPEGARPAVMDPTAYPEDARALLETFEIGGVYFTEDGRQLLIVGRIESDNAHAIALDGVKKAVDPFGQKGFMFYEAHQLRRAPVEGYPVSRAAEHGHAFVWGLLHVEETVDVSTGAF